MVLSTQNRTRYSSELTADLQEHFEAGKGYIGKNGRNMIRQKYGLTNNKIQNWAYSRRMKHGVYGEKTMVKHFQNFCKNPCYQKLTNCYNLLVEVIMTWIKINGFKK